MMQVIPSQLSFLLISKDQAEAEFGPGTVAPTDFPRREETTVDLEPTDAPPVALLRGFDVQFDPSGDGRPLGNLQVAVDVVGTEEVMIDNEPKLRVTVEVVFGLRDWSNDWDDAHGGTVYFYIIA